MARALGHHSLTLLVLLIAAVEGGKGNECSNFNAVRHRVISGCAKDGQLLHSHTLLIDNLDSLALESCLHVDRGRLSDELWASGFMGIRTTHASCFFHALEQCSMQESVLRDFLVQDLLYCQESAVAHEIAANRSAGHPLEKYLRNEAVLYRKYESSLLDFLFDLEGGEAAWASSQGPSGACLNYTNTLKSIAEHKHPLVFMAATLPCHWTWGVLANCTIPTLDTKCDNSSAIHRFVHKVMFSKEQRPHTAMLIDEHAVIATPAVMMEMHSAFKTAIRLEFSLFNEQMGEDDAPFCTGLPG